MWRNVMLNIFSYKRTENKNDIEILSHPSQYGDHQENIQQ
jgi:hypothetical protein